MYIKAGKLFDGRADRLREGAAVLVEGGKTAPVGVDLPAPAGHEVLDLGGFTLMHGLVPGRASSPPSSRCGASAS